MQACWRILQGRRWRTRPCFVHWAELTPQAGRLLTIFQIFLGEELTMRKPGLIALISSVSNSKATFLLVHILVLRNHFFCYKGAWFTLLCSSLLLWNSAFKRFKTTACNMTYSPNGTGKGYQHCLPAVLSLVLYLFVIHSINMHWACITHQA